jgi:putative membrane protein
MMWHTGEGFGWWMILGSVWMFFFWAFIIWIVFRVVSPGERTEHRDDTPLEIARRRYARGDISRDEFEQLRRDLNG